MGQQVIIQMKFTEIVHIIQAAILNMADLVVPQAQPIQGSKSIYIYNDIITHSKGNIY